MTSGRHNDDLEKSTQRIIEGATWKKQRVISLIPAAKLMPTRAHISQASLMFPPNQGVYRMAAIGLEVGDAYSQSIEGILNTPELCDWEYLLTVEHDNLPPADGVLKLIKRMDEHPEFACIGGLYWTKGEGGVPQIWGDVKDPVLNFRPQPPVPGQLVECCGTGMGFNLFRLSMFKDQRLEKPWFKTTANSTQDLRFWGDARKYGYRCAIDCDVLVGHLDNDTGIVW